MVGLGVPDAQRGDLRRGHAETGKQSKKTLLDLFERYIERYMTLFEGIWSV